MLAALIAFTLSKIFGLLLFYPRPFVVGIGQTFLEHAPDSSFPSDHGTGILSVAIALTLCQLREARRVGRTLLVLAIPVCWSRVFLGVHWPLDMVCALVVSGVAAVLANSRAGQAVAAALGAPMQLVYRRLLATPIARGWLRP